ncbi:MAG: adenylosuccinate lyase [Methylacidiphilales bacterium]|nr:adenylosuccinate lyase [Candidatus Methylacidiphilales bacterium]
MIARYARPEMTAIWEERTKLDLWLEVEVTACEVMAELGWIPVEDARVIRERARYDVEAVRGNEARTQHDVLAFLEEVAAQVGPAGRWIHQGLTSSDVLDTAFAVQLCRACDLLLADVEGVIEAVRRRAVEYMLTPMMGRTHGVHGEPITYGYKLAGMVEEFRRAARRLRAGREEVAVGKISGAMGTYAHGAPELERRVCERLGLRAERLSTQVVPRDRHAALMQVWALVATSVERWAVEFRHLQRTEVLEVEEYFAEGQKGSSAMPHKRNPIVGERLCGLARVVRGYAVTALENVALWHERDISHSSAERVIFPDAAVALDYMLNLLRELVERQLVYPERMRQNLEQMRGLYGSQGLLLELTRKGVGRREAYEAVQAAAMACWRDERERPFVEHVREVPLLREKLSDEEIAAACGLERHVRWVREKFEELGLVSP